METTTNTDILNEGAASSGIVRPAPEALHLPPYPSRLVTESVSPLYAEPDPLSEQVTQALLGMEVSEIGLVDGWRFIQTPDKYVGWIPAADLRELPQNWEGSLAEVTDLWANLRGRPSYKVAPVSRAFIGSRLPLASVDATRGWAQLVLPDGRHAWTELHRVQIIGDEPLRPNTAAAICDTARRFLGTPYLWGGCSPLGIDCSGFVQLTMRLHGISLLRDAGPQATQGRPIEQPNAADLVFFGPPNEQGGITHVGMMLDEENFIHAAGGRYVQINRLWDEPYRSRFRFARRYLEA